MVRVLLVGAGAMKEGGVGLLGDMVLLLFLLLLLQLLAEPVCVGSWGRPETGGGGGPSSLQHCRRRRLLQIATLIVSVPASQSSHTHTDTRPSSLSPSLPPSPTPTHRPTAARGKARVDKPNKARAANQAQAGVNPPENNPHPARPRAPCKAPPSWRSPQGPRGRQAVVVVVRCTLPPLSFRRARYVWAHVLPSSLSSSSPPPPHNLTILSNTRRQRQRAATPRARAW